MKFIILSQIFWLIETWYFGWNFYPSCHAERHGDQIVIALFYLGRGMIIGRKQANIQR